MPKNIYGINIEEIAQYNIKNGTHFWRQDQIDADIAKRKRLQQSQQIYDSTDPFSIGDDVRAAYIYAGKRPETTKDQDRIDQFDKDAKATNLAGLGAIATLPLLGEFATYGPLVGALRIGAGTAGSAAGSWTLGKAGDFADSKLNTNFLGTTGRIAGGLVGFGAGTKATEPIFRRLAGKGITLHMPQETFANLRGQYFDRVANNIKFDNSIPWKLYNRDRLVKDYLEFGPDANVLGDNISKLVHWDPLLETFKKVRYTDSSTAIVSPQHNSSKITDFISGEMFYPTELNSQIDEGFKAASTFFQHPIVKNSYTHNKELAKRLGIILQDRPTNISEVVKRPAKTRYQLYQPEDGNVELMSIEKEYFDDPNTVFNITNMPMTKKLARSGALHEGLHLGYYGEPIRMNNMPLDYVISTYMPSSKYWNWKSKKLLNKSADYLMDVSEPGPNLIEVGKAMGLKLGQKYPGEKAFNEIIKTSWPTHKENLLSGLDLETRAGKRHVWDAMTGQYFGLTVPVAGAWFTTKNHKPE